MTACRASALLAAALGLTVCLPAQVAISTHSGLIQFTVGSVYVGDQPIHKTTTNLPDVKNGQVLRTGEDGNAEVLLTPGVFVRLGSNASFRMDSNALSDTRVTLLSGVAMVECDELLEDNAVSFTVGRQAVEFRKKGLFRLEANPPSVAAIKGDAYVAGTLNTNVKHGKELALDSAAPQLQKFHLNKKDDLYLFSQARAEDSAYATNVTASSLYSSGYNCGSSSWYLMSSVGMYSYLPCSGMFANPFGAYMLGMNYGYLWNGPNYYVPPMGMIGMPLRGGGGGGVVANNPTNVAATPAAHPGGVGSGTPARHTLPQATHPTMNAAFANRGTSVPVFVGPGYRGAPPRVELFRQGMGTRPYARITSSNPGFHGHSGMMSGTGSAVANPGMRTTAGSPVSRQAMRNMAGPAMGHPAMRSMGRSFHSNPGGMRNGGGFGRGANSTGGFRGGFGGARGASPGASPSAAPASGGAHAGGPRGR